MKSFNVVLFSTIAAAPSGAVLLKQHESNFLQKPKDPPKPAEIKENFEKLDEFLGVMFTMACKWKNGKDVAGAGAEALKKGEVDGADGYATYVKDLQAKNVKGLQRACGFMTGEHKKKCRDGCAARWNQAAGKRDECDQKCESVYSNFERSCMAKADGLKDVYRQKAAKAAGQKQCYEGHCGEFPTVWMKEKTSDMETEVKDQCKKRCTEKALETRCQEKWAVQVDMVQAEVHSDCAAKSGVSKCFDKKKGETTKDFDKCKSDSKKDCGKAFDDCKKKGNTDKTFKDAEAFCTDRKKMCLDQGDKKCIADNKKALDKAEDECEAKAAKETSKCEEKTLDKNEKAASKKCISDSKPTCKDDCHDTCKITKMQDCLVKITQKDDPGKLFCKDMWDLLHGSSETDPVTGDPIALLSTKK